MSQWNAKYKCRNCGKVFTTVSCNSSITVMSETIATLCGVKSGDPMQPGMYEFHICDGTVEKGNRGIADFIGWEYEEVEDSG